MILHPMLRMLAEMAALERGETEEEAKRAGEEYARFYAIQAQSYHQTCRAIEALAKRSGLTLVRPNDPERAECDFG